MNKKYKDKSTAIPLTAPVIKQPDRTPGPITRFVDEELPWKARCFVANDGDYFDEWGHDKRGTYVFHNHVDVYNFLLLDEKPKLAFIRFVPSAKDHFNREEVMKVIATLFLVYPVIDTIEQDIDDGDCIIAVAEDYHLLARALDAQTWIDKNFSKYCRESKYYNEEDTFD